MLVSTTIIEHIDRMGRKFKHDVHTVRCDTCGKEWETRVSRAKLSYSKTHSCSKECKLASNKAGGAAAEARKRTCLERFGAENAFSSEVCKQKIAETMLRKHGVDHPSKSKAIRNKAKQTLIERFGVENPGQSAEIMTKARETMFRRHGVEYPMQMQSTKDALTSGTIAKFGQRSFYGSETFKQHMLDKFGVEHPYDSHEIREKAIKTYNEHYGVDNVSQSEYFANLPVRSGQHKSGYITVKGKSIWFRSSYEKRFLIWCENNVNVLSVDCNIPVNYVFENKTHRYFIDFRVQYTDGKQALFEVKSAYAASLQKNQAKFEAARSQLNTLQCDSFSVITEIELKLIGA